MTLSDGRELAWTEFGVREGWPVFGFHGTPGSRHQLRLYDEQARGAGIRIVAPDRPGYGLSTFQAGRRLVDWPRDVERLADQLGVGRFSVLGISGGGPHALVTAALLPSRVARAGVVSGAVPLRHPQIATAITRSEKTVALVARRAPILLQLFTSAEILFARYFSKQAFDIFVRQLSPPDAAIVRQPEVRSLFQREMTTASVTTGRAWAQDLSLFASDWGFELSTIKVPVVLWQGSEDRVSQEAHTRVVADEIQGSQLRHVEGHGHLLVLDDIGIMRDLVPPPDGGDLHPE